MAGELTFKLKMMKSLYGMGFKGMGATVLEELRKGGPEWLEFVQEILEGTDYPLRKVVLKHLTGRNFIDRSKQKDQLVAIMMSFLGAKNAIGEEKKTALKFAASNLALFPVDDDDFRGKVLALSRDTDSTLSQVASDLLPKIGVNMDDKDLYRR